MALQPPLPPPLPLPPKAVVEPRLRLLVSRSCPEDDRAKADEEEGEGPPMPPTPTLAPTPPTPTLAPTPLTPTPALLRASSRLLSILSSIASCSLAVALTSSPRCLPMARALELGGGGLRRKKNLFKERWRKKEQKKVSKVFYPRTPLVDLDLEKNAKKKKN